VHQLSILRPGVSGCPIFATGSSSLRWGAILFVIPQRSGGICFCFFVCHPCISTLPTHASRVYHLPHVYKTHHSPPSSPVRPRRRTAAALASRISARSLLAQAAAPAPRIAPGPFKPTWDSLNAYKTPDWFRDAKFGIWNHWSAQCVPARVTGMPARCTSRATGSTTTTSPPTDTLQVGFMELTNLWKAETGKPEEFDEPLCRRRG